MDQDLASRQEARELAQLAQQAQQKLRTFSQAQLDQITKAICQAFSANAARLGKMAQEETGFGNAKDKETKNRFASEKVYEAIASMKTVGLLEEDPEKKLWEIGVPVGVIAAIVPSTNPTSTVCHNAMIALKAGCAIVFTPHPAAAKCTVEAVEVVAQAAREAGCPSGTVSCMKLSTMEGTRELMTCPQVRLILATGGPGMVKAAYSSGKPAIGVGAGNGPAYIHGSADVSRAVEQILSSKTFDNGIICASEQSILVERNLDQRVRQELSKQGGYLMNDQEAQKVGQLLFRPDGRLNPKIVGKTAADIARQAGISIPSGTRVLLAQQTQVGDSAPYSWEKLCPVLAYYVEENEAQILRRSQELLYLEGAGHSFMMHAQDEAVVRRFALEIPVSRFLVNTPGALGGIGATTNLFPAMTLGCGAVGGSSSSNNIGPMDLINVRRVAWGTESHNSQPLPNEDLISALAAEIMKKFL